MGSRNLWRNWIAQSCCSAGITDIIIIDKNVKSKSFYNASDLTCCVTTGNYLSTLNKCNECDASFSKKILEEKRIKSVHEEKKPNFDTCYENIKKEILPCPSVEGTFVFIFLRVKWQ